jgi:hypothetical protein
MEKAAIRGMFFVNDVKQGIHSPTVPTIVKPKAVFTRPSLYEFFTTISEFAARVLILELNEEVYYGKNCRVPLSWFATIV